MAGTIVTPKLLELAAKRNCFAIPEKGLIFFGIRGALPDGPASTSFAPQHSVSFGPIDHINLRCTIGQWNRDTGQIALFPGSTVPSQGSVASAVKNNGRGTNMLLPGKYRHEKGEHRKGTPNGHRAFRQSCFMPVQRTVNNSTYDKFDRYDFGSSGGDYVFDNIHCAHTETMAGFSSAGCQVIQGRAKSSRNGFAPERGPWATFINNAYDHFPLQKQFDYLLFKADELGVAESSDQTQVTINLKFGSSGAQVKELQQALTTAGFYRDKLDSDYGRLTTIAVAAYQAKQFGTGGTDCECGRNTSAALNLKFPSLAKVGAADSSKVEPDAHDGVSIEQPDDTDLTDEELRHLLLVLFGVGSANKPPEPEDIVLVPPSAEVPEDGLPGTIETLADSSSETSMRNFERAQDIVKEYEGGFANHRLDKGGPTNFGITHKTLARWRKVASVSALEVERMSYAEAKEIYKAWYWDVNKCGKLPGPMALVVYNTGVHCGTGRAAEYLQMALNANGAKLKVDNKIGKDTLEAVAAVSATAAVTDKLIELYNAKIMSIDNVHVFAEGFRNRVAKLRRETTKWLAEASVAPTPKVSMPTVPPVITNDPVPVQKGERKMSNIADVLKKILAELSGAVAAAEGQTGNGGVAAPVKPDVLGPVNGALGGLLGELLNGKKSIIGIVGSILTSMMGSADPTSTLGQIGALVTKAIPILGGSSGAALPIFVAVAAWGFLGKMEKMLGQSK